MNYLILAQYEKIVIIFLLGKKKKKKLQRKERFEVCKQKHYKNCFSQSHNKWK